MIVRDGTDSATPARALLMLPIITVFIVPLLLIRFRLNVLSLGEEEAQGLGIHVEPTRWLALSCVAGITAASVANTGMIGWVGLVFPHFARAVVGPDHRQLLPAAAMIGATYMLIIDTLARTLISAELPLGVLTALIGAPIFVLILHRTQNQGWQ